MQQPAVASSAKAKAKKLDTRIDLRTPDLQGKWIDGLYELSFTIINPHKAVEFRTYTSTPAKGYRDHKYMITSRTENNAFGMYIQPVKKLSNCPPFIAAADSLCRNIVSRIMRTPLSSASLYTATHQICRTNTTHLPKKPILIWRGDSTTFLQPKRSICVQRKVPKTALLSSTPPRQRINQMLSFTTTSSMENSPSGFHLLKNGANARARSPKTRVSIFS